MCRMPPHRPQWQITYSSAAYAALAAAVACSVVAPLASEFAFACLYARHLRFFFAYDAVNSLAPRTGFRGLLLPRAGFTTGLLLTACLPTCDATVGLSSRVACRPPFFFTDNVRLAGLPPA